MGIAVVALIGLFLGTYLTLYKFGYIGQLACGVGSCERVQTSRWSMLLGIPVATWGLGYYVLVFAIALVGIQPRFAESRGVTLTLLLLTGWGVLFTGWLTSLEAWVIHAWCEWCLGSASLVLLLFLLALWDWIAERRLAPGG